MNKWIEFLKNNDFISVKKYIKDGADVNEANETGESVLANAIRHRCDMDLLMLLIENGADIHDFDDEGVGIFDMSITYNNMEMVEYMIAQGIDVNFTNRRSRFTPLMAAASYGRADIAKLLLEHGADQEMLDTKGFSAVDLARKMNKKSILDILEYDKDNPKNKAYTR
ncbi:protein containing ankyrin repeat [Sulfurimonas gotlandica GD1]|jgi:ankyrin repeat protein|uniref:Protein containing ankyrin repeat n=1 Tax=Sulfurimonas gotlandica (strain DSM 19862 / JCM 16533 / GD1) TaxID=929558 RepID=B6BJJ4_SULGG|nr:ankyrin repeat domain-containing protein [Sulfurimonas gotlandica]EDZ62748.1 ankyrin repeat protein [Sulfurimonas gotlandica GD1]EHP31239.1 protein containing ankyrin repeat [Sulfurimonas gotlandica GD1]